MSQIGHTPAEEAAMLAAVGVGSFEELVAQVPAELRLSAPLDLPPAMTESELRRFFVGLASRNYDPQITPSFLGGGLYDHAIPALIDALVSRSEFCTAYTPYQPEVAQGTLAAIFEFQTMICELTGMEVANASMYDGASAIGEALLLAHAANGGRQVLVAPGLNPRVRGVAATYLEGSGVTLTSLPESSGCIDLAGLRASLSAAGDVAAVLVQQPSFYGLIEPLDQLAALLGPRGPRRTHLVVSADPLSLGVLAPPGVHGAETVCGDLQPLGTPPQFGGPSAGYFATRREWVRRLPGRLVAEARDGAGRRGFALTLQTREQHIRREKATSNICTNSGLIALRATIYLALMGPLGLREVAEQCLARSRYALERVLTLPGVERVYPGPFFREFVVRLPRPAEEVVARVYAQARILAGIPLSRFADERQGDLLVAVTEQRNRMEIDAWADALGRALRAG